MIRNLKLLAIASVVVITVMGDRVASTKNSLRITTHKDEAAAPAELIDVFDVSVQKRFHEVLGFGMARITPPERQFAPETAEEKAAVKAFKKANLTVAMFLVGRLVLAPKPEQKQFENYSFFKHAISSPRFVRVNTKPRRLPGRWDLWEPGNEALTMFDEGKDSYEGRVGEWSVRARPVRSDETCLQCHQADHRVVFTQPTGASLSPTGHSIRVGDPVGAVFYLYLQPPEK